jgi:hypothetical protein
MANNQNPGIIQEQGFVQGTGLGFQPLTESEKQKIADKFKEDSQQPRNK